MEKDNSDHEIAAYVSGATLGGQTAISHCEKYVEQTRSLLQGFTKLSI